MMASAATPTVTALVPTYNGAAFVARTLDSLAQQTWPALDILIGDDASTDETAAIVDAFASTRDHVRVFHQPSNVGWLRNSNDLMSRAQGEFCFFAFHDDVLAPTYVERLIEALSSDAVLSFSDMTVNELDGTTSTHIFDDLTGLSSPAQRGLVMARRPANWWVPNRGLFRTSAYRSTGGIHENASGEFSADWTWLLHLALLGAFVRVPETLCHKHYTKQSLSKTWPHVARQRVNLIVAGLHEVRRSSAGVWTKVVVGSYLIGRLVPVWARAMAKRSIRGRD